jgi:hypothetical protein
MGIAGWTSMDDTELLLYVEAGLHRKKSKDRSDKSPTNHRLYKRMNEGPQYITRAGLLFLHALWDHDNLDAFDHAVKKHGYAPAAPAGLIQTLKPKKGARVSRTRPWPEDWVDRQAVTSVYGQAIGVEVDQSSIEEQITAEGLSMEAVSQADQGDIDQGVEPPSPDAMSRMSDQFEPLHIDYGPESSTYPTSTPAKRHSDAGESAHTLCDTPAEASAKSTKRVRFALPEYTEKGELPDISALFANDSFHDSDRIDRLEALVGQMQHDLEEVKEQYDHVHERVDNLAVMDHRHVNDFKNVLEFRIEALEIAMKDTLEAVEAQNDTNKKLSREVEKIWTWCAALGQRLVPQQDKTPQLQKD